MTGRHVPLSVRQAVFKYLDHQPAGIIYGLHLQQTINAKTKKETFASTILKYAKDYADASGAELICLKKQESKYQFTPGFKIFGALSGGKE
jgi:hypothetical protein